MPQVERVSKLVEDHRRQVDFAGGCSLRPFEAIIEPHFRVCFVFLSPGAFDGIAVVVDEDKRKRNTQDIGFPEYRFKDVGGQEANKSKSITTA